MKINSICEGITHSFDLSKVPIPEDPIRSWKVRFFKSNVAF